MIRIALMAGTLLVLPLGVRAAELPVPKLHKVHRVVHHRREARAVRHFGYYFGRFGWRTGGTAGSWYGSTFALAGPDGTDVLLASSPKGVSAIHCPARRPLVCLAEPVVVPLAAAGRIGWR